MLPLLSALHILLCGLAYRIRGQHGWAGTQIKRAAWGLIVCLPIFLYDGFTLDTGLAYLLSAVLAFLGLIYTGHGAEQHYSENHLMGDGKPSDMEEWMLEKHGQGWFQENADWPLRLFSPYKLRWSRKKKKLYKLAQATLIGLMRTIPIAAALWYFGVASEDASGLLILFAGLGYAATLEAGKLLRFKVKDPLNKGLELFGPPNNELLVGLLWGLGFNLAVAL